MGANNRQSLPVSLSCYVGTVTAATLPLAYFTKKFKLTGVFVMNQGAVTGDTADGQVLNVQLGSTVLATITTNTGTDLVANVAKALTLTATVQEIAAGSTLKLVATQTKETDPTATLTLAKIILTGYWA